MLISSPGYVFGNGVTMSPEGNLFGLDQDVIYQIDPMSGVSNIHFTFPSGTPLLQGLVSGGNNFFYSMKFDEDLLFEINVTTGIITNLGSTAYKSDLDLVAFDGQYYYRTYGPGPTDWGIVRLDINAPSNSELVISSSSFVPIVGMSASSVCYTLIIGGKFNSSDETFSYLSLIDGAIIPICEAPINVWYFSSMSEYEPPIFCGNKLDLDCNDSSGAMEADFNAPDFDCLSGAVPVSDIDIGLFYDAIITELTLQLIGFVPDLPNEKLNISGTVPGISASGAGTQTITLSNAGGAKSTDFKEALKLILYNNTSVYPTGGLRTVEVQFTTESGSMSNIATAYIQVNELPLVMVNLGPDQELCEGETATFNAGNPGASYQWSNGPTTQTITVGNDGQYIVTVSDGVNCPNQDTVILDILPVIHVSLTGDTEICDNESAQLIISSDAPFPVSVEISAQPGSPFVFNNISGTFNFIDLPDQSTVYTITNVIPSQPACIELTDSIQVIDVFPSYVLPGHSGKIFGQQQRSKRYPGHYGWFAALKKRSPGRIRPSERSSRSYALLDSQKSRRIE
jgi:hypothetical protein